MSTAMWTFRAKLVRSGSGGQPNPGRPNDPKLTDLNSNIVAPRLLV